MNPFDEVKRENLIIGNRYYFDDRKHYYGMFVSRSKENNETVFKPIFNKEYYLDERGMVVFDYNGDGFYPKL